jgi:hypothetical protein
MAGITGAKMPIDSLQTLNDISFRFGFDEISN